MRYFIIAIFVLFVSCKDTAGVRFHKEAKAKGIVCYTILIPAEIAGHYCLTYEGDKF